MSNIEFNSPTSLDAFFEPVKIRRKTAAQIKQKGLVRVAGTNFLINPAKRDLWQLTQEGTLVRCFEEDEIIEE
jgi:hypothetical protein